MTRLLLVLLALALPLVAAPSSKDPARWIAAVSPGLLQVEFSLQFDRGDAPHGILDQDPRSTGPRSNSLADLVAEERPLETTGFLVGPTTVVAMDPSPLAVEAVQGRTVRTLASSQVLGG
ncbi:MAG: hypothetical protein EBU81_10420, partial [Proteobacteria bacterium]|nr:hypothetical protein [Pseudomonadota bacterium]